MLKLLKSLFIICLLVISCTSDEVDVNETNEPESNTPSLPVTEDFIFSIENSNLLRNGSKVSYKGVNALQTFGLVDPEEMDTWKIEIVREFIGNLGEQPIDGAAIQGSDGVWYHPLQAIVDRNRAHNRITIFCPFGWVYPDGNQLLFTGLNPSQQDFYDSYASKMQQIAKHFKNQSDVWIEVWNEPYHWNNQNNYSHDLWLSDMEEMVDNLRTIEGFQNIILVPGNEQGQSEEVILERGAELLNQRFNLLFDIHAYKKWLMNTSKDQIKARIQKLNEKGFSIIFGEVGVQNVETIMPVKHFLEAVEDTKTSTLAWLWSKNSTYNNSLMDDYGHPNSHEDNNFWGETFKDYLHN